MNNKAQVHRQLDHRLLSVFQAFTDKPAPPTILPPTLARLRGTPSHTLSRKGTPEDPGVPSPEGVPWQQFSNLGTTANGRK